jgi:hypothetical protein
MRFLLFYVVTILDEIFIILCCDYFDEIFIIFEKIYLKPYKGGYREGEDTKKLF